MRAANQQRSRLDFTAINRLHVPVALVSMLLAMIVFGRGLWRRPFDDLTLLAETVTLTLLGNAFICAAISGPHDRYGARMAWVATFVVLQRRGNFSARTRRANAQLRRERKSMTPVL
jgi:hypothetical protein